MLTPLADIRDAGVRVILLSPRWAEIGLRRCGKGHGGAAVNEETATKQTTSLRALRRAQLGSVVEVENLARALTGVVGRRGTKTDVTAREAKSIRKAKTQVWPRCCAG